MRVSCAWLKEYVDFSLSPEELAEALTLAGLEVEQVEHLAPGWRGPVCLGRLEDVRPHPDSDHLKVCRVTVGAGRSVQVVSGAANLVPGAGVVVALPGSVLPGPRPIEATVFRGVTSEGMLCSAPELGLEGSKDGILLLPGDVQPGQDAAEALGLDDVVLEIDLTANRADCESMINVAREVAAVTGAPLRPAAQVQPPGATAGEAFAIPLARGGAAAGATARQSPAVQVTVQDHQLCPLYTARLFGQVRLGPSPLWMQNRLRAAGVRPISNVVDVTNYVMLECNQPLHAFDFAQVSQGHIVVRRASAGEKLQTLDGVERTLDEQMLVIADPTRPIGLAGVMGGANSEITGTTSMFLLESALFAATSVRRTAFRLGIPSEAASRFGRGVDPQGVVRASQRAAALFQEIGAAQPLGPLVQEGSAPSRPVEIRLRPQRVNALLGTGLTDQEIRTTLQRLPGFSVAPDAGALRVSVPSYRMDISAEVDLVEEVARLWGYHRIPSTMPAGVSQRGGLSPKQRFERSLRDILVGLGFSEVMTSSIVDPGDFERLRLPDGHPWRRAVALLAPLSADQAVLRTTLLPGLLQRVAYNQHRQNDDLAFFELGKAFISTEQGQLPEEVPLLGLVLTGRRDALHFSRKPEPADFFDLKGALEELLEAAGLSASEYEFDPLTGHPSLHPGRSAELRLGSVRLGYLGEVHPQVAEAFDLTGRVLVAELEYLPLLEAQQTDLRVAPLPRHPAVRRDLAVVVDQQIPARRLLNILREAGKPWLEKVEIFDVYRGGQVPEGKKSIAFSLTFRSAERTLTDAQVLHAQAKVVEALREQVGAEIRS